MQVDKSLAGVCFLVFIYVSSFIQDCFASLFFWMGVLTLQLLKNPDVRDDVKYLADGNSKYQKFLYASVLRLWNISGWLHRIQTLDSDVSRDLVQRDPAMPILGYHSVSSRYTIRLHNIPGGLAWSKKLTYL